jgi:hypothetical protein
VSGEQELVRINAKPEVNQQMGFGKSDNIEQSDSNDINEGANDIDFKSAEKVDPTILNAFDNPVIRVQSGSFVPPKNTNDVQKIIQEKVRIALNKKKSAISKKSHKLNLV